eukprot:1474668-Pleurochrysis_carterae.AAC.1
MRQYVAISQENAIAASPYPFPRVQTNYSGFRSLPPRAPTVPDRSKGCRTIRSGLLKVGIFTRAVGDRHFEGRSRSTLCENTLRCQLQRYTALESGAHQ